MDSIRIPEGSPYVKVTRTINRPAKEAFEYIIGVDLTHIFPRYGDAPGIASTTVSEGWGVAGQQRINTWDDGSTLRETMLDVDPGRSFSYRSDDFTTPALQALLDRIEGGWIFTENDNQTTSIEWIYSLVAEERAREDPDRGAPPQALPGPARSRIDRHQGRPRGLRADTAAAAPQSELDSPFRGHLRELRRADPHARGERLTSLQPALPPDHQLLSSAPPARWGSGRSRRRRSSPARSWAPR